MAGLWLFMKHMAFFTKLAMSTSLSIPGPKEFTSTLNSLIVIKFSNFEAALFNEKII